MKTLLRGSLFLVVALIVSITLTGCDMAKIGEIIGKVADIMVKVGTALKSFGQNLTQNANNNTNTATNTATIATTTVPVTTTVASPTTDPQTRPPPPRPLRRPLSARPKRPPTRMRQANNPLPPVHSPILTRPLRGSVLFLLTIWWALSMKDAETCHMAHNTFTIHCLDLHRCRRWGDAAVRFGSGSRKGSVEHPQGLLQPDTGAGPLLPRSMA
jgi:hypothetical protein